MCKGPEDTPQNIKDCLRNASDQFLVAMLEDWNRESKGNSTKMQECINEVLNERKVK